MGQGVSRPSYDAGSHRPPRPSLDHLRDECRELSTPRRPRPQAWFRATADARDNQGKRLIDAQRQSKSGAEKKSLRTSGLKAIMTSLPAAASNPDCRRRSHPDCRATTHGEQEMSVWNGHYACTCYHPLFVFNQFGDLERCALRPGNVHSADGWDGVLKPVVARYQGKLSRIYFRADAAFAMPEVYEFLEAERIKYAIRLPANQVLQSRIGYLLKRPVGRPAHHVRRFHANFSYQAGTWTKPRRVIAKVEWHPGELYPRVGFTVTNMNRPAERVVAFYNKRGTCEQWIKEGKGAIKWTRLSCRTFAANAVRLQLHALAYNLGNFLRTLATPEPIKDWSLTSWKEKLIKIGAKVMSHGRYVAFQMAEVAIPRQMFQEILRLIAELRPPPPPALA